MWPLKKTLANPCPRPFIYTHIHSGAGKFRFPRAALRISTLIKGMRGRGREKFYQNGQLEICSSCYILKKKEKTGYLLGLIVLL